MSKSIQIHPTYARIDLKSVGPIWGSLLYIQRFHAALDSRFAAASLRHLQKQGEASGRATIEPSRESLLVRLRLTQVTNDH